MLVLGDASIVTLAWLLSSSLARSRPVVLEGCTQLENIKKNGILINICLLSNIIECGHILQQGLNLIKWLKCRINNGRRHGKG